MVKTIAVTEYADFIRYETLKDGGIFMVLIEVIVMNVLKNINENLAEEGMYLNCGAHHDIAECERCSQHYIDYENDDIMLCDNCKECRNNGVVPT